MELLRDALRSSLRRSLGQLGVEDRLHAAWPLVCGSALAIHSEVLHVDTEDVLHVRVTDPEWRERFFEMRARITADLARVAGAKLAGIHFEKLPQRRGKNLARAAEPKNAVPVAEAGSGDQPPRIGAAR